MQVAERQCAYDGALMADAAREVHEYLGKSPEEFYRHTQALTVALDGKYVLVHGHHIMPGEASGSLEYHQFSLNEFTPRRSLAEYRALYKYIRNSQDWARERSTEKLEELHALAKSRQTALSAVKGLKSARTGASASNDTSGYQPPFASVTPPVSERAIAGTNRTPIPDKTIKRDRLSPHSPSVSKSSALSDTVAKDDRKSTKGPRQEMYNSKPMSGHESSPRTTFSPSTKRPSDPRSKPSSADLGIGKPSHATAASGTRDKNYLGLP